MPDIRNIAIIAHVDHGKTTLVDKMLHAAAVFRSNEAVGELIMDSGDLERERGITIRAKNCAITYKGQKINILDTPGHSDFGGEVERVLRMADAVVLLVDAFEGPMPQTRFVTRKAVELGLKFLVVINKVDKPNCRPDETLDKVFDLLVELDATEAQLDFPIIYGSGKNGWMGPDYKTPTTDISYLLDTILEAVKPAPVREGGLQMQITSLDYSNFVGRIAIGRVYRGEVVAGKDVALVKRDGTVQKHRIKEVHVFDGLGRQKVDQAPCGDIVALVGIDGFDIGDTVTAIDTPEALPPISIDEPTMNMLFTINDSPFFGKEGKFVTSRHLADRLRKETEMNLALRVEDGPQANTFIVYGRGVLHLSVLIETMRREGYEFQVGQPRVIIKEIEGVKHEPIELLVVDVPEDSAGAVIERVSQRKGELKVMEPKGNLQHLEFHIPSRGLIGLRNELLTATSGEAIMAHRFIEYQPWKGKLEGRNHGVLISMGTGPVVAFALFKLNDRGRFFVAPGDEVYGGMILGETPRAHDLVVNVQKAKQLTNIRAAGSDENVQLEPPTRFSLEQFLEYIQADEYVEVTPQSIRMRKIYLDENDRKRYTKQLEAVS